MQEKSKILLLSTSYLPHVGGSELALKNITDRLTDFEFDLVTGRLDESSPKQEKIGNVNVYRAGNSFNSAKFLLPKALLPLAVFFKARELIKKNKYICVHAYQASQAAGAGWLLKFLYPKIPLIVTIQEGKNLASQGILINFLRNAILRKADRFTVISNYLSGYLKSLKTNAPISIIPNGVDLEVFNKKDGSAIRKKLNIMSDDKVIITVSRLVIKNGIDFLIDAIAQLNKDLKYSVKLLIIGEGGPEEDRTGELKNLVSKHGLENRVIFAGTISNEDLPEYLSVADIFVRPSRSEGLGTAFLEAMAVGLPVIGTPVGGILDFITDGETGFLWRNSDGSLAQKIEQALENKELSSRVALNGWDLVVKKYNWDKIAQSFREIYLSQ